jgi:broad specificity phosphatase PhoE
MALDLHSQLSTLGMKQTRDLGRALAQQDVVCPFILCSVYDRCLETAVQISLEIGCIPIRVEYGLSEGPVSQVQVFKHNKFLKHTYPLLDDMYVSHTSPPDPEYNQEDVLPRCAHMAEYISSLVLESDHISDLIVVTHGTVAIGLAASMVRRPHETIHDSIARLEGCAPAGVYKIVPLICTAGASLSWQTDGKCGNTHLSKDARKNGTPTTPTCYIHPPTTKSAW